MGQPKKMIMDYTYGLDGWSSIYPKLQAIYSFSDHFLILVNIEGIEPWDLPLKAVTCWSHEGVKRFKVSITNEKLTPNPEDHLEFII